MLSDLFYRLRTLLHRQAVNRELDEELQYHLDREAAKYGEAAPDEAMRRAKVALGGTEQVRQQSREARGTMLFDNLIQDFGYALRQLRRSIGFSLAVILTLTLAIGVNSAVFSLLDGFLLRTLPYPHPERIGVLMTHIEVVRGHAARVYIPDSLACGCTRLQVHASCSAPGSECHCVQTGLQHLPGLAVMTIVF